MKSFTTDQNAVLFNETKIQSKKDQLQLSTAISTTKSFTLSSELKSIRYDNTSFKEMLGKGSYGVVMKAKWNSGLFGLRKKAVAIKIIRTNNTNIMNQEITTMHRLKHSNIVELFGYGSMPNGDYFIVMELMDGGSIDRVIHNKNTKISVGLLNNWTAQIVNGLAFIHDNEHIHCNLKPSNLLLSKNHQLVKIGDFGTVRDQFATSIIKQQIDTLIYIAPEVIFDQKYTSKCDVYSLGITLCEMYTRRRPYQGISNEGLINKIQNGMRPVMGDDEVDAGIRSIIERCWDNNSHQRPSISEILHLTTMVKLNRKLAQIDENDLKTIAEDELKSEMERMMSLIRLANIWGNTIDDDQLYFISDRVYNLNNQLNSFDTDQLSGSFANRLQLIESIVIDREKHCLDINWKNHYGLLLYNCFYFHSLRFNSYNHITEFDQSIHDRICQLIIDKMQFVLSDNNVISIITENDACLNMKSLYRLTKLINAYRIKIDTADLQLLNQQFDQTKIYYSNDYYITEIVKNLLSINQRIK